MLPHPKDALGRPLSEYEVSILMAKTNSISSLLRKKGTSLLLVSPSIQSLSRSLDILCRIMSPVSNPIVSSRKKSK